MTSHSSKGYRTVKNLGNTTGNQINFAGPSSKMVNNAGIDTKINIAPTKRARKGKSERLNKA